MRDIVIDEIGVLEKLGKLSYGDLEKVSVELNKAPFDEFVNSSCVFVPDAL